MSVRPGQERRPHARPSRARGLRPAHAAATPQVTVRSLSTPNGDPAPRLHDLVAQLQHEAGIEREAALERHARRLAGALALLLALATGARAGAPVIALDSLHVMGVAHRGQPFMRPRAIALDPAHGEVIVANTGLGRVEYFDYRTWPKGFFTHEVPGPDGRSVPGEPIALAVTPTGDLLVSDFKAPWVSVLDYRGRTLRRITLPAPDDRADGRVGPGAIAVAPDGRVLVASRGEGRIHVYDAALRPLGSWGVTGLEPGQLQDVTALAVDSTGRVFVTCAATKYAVQVFQQDGSFAYGFGRHELGPGHFSLPSGLAFLPGQRVCVSDAIRQIVQVFGTDGTFVGTFGGAGVGLGEFHEPSALAGDGRGTLALAEKSGSRFQVLWLR